MAWLSRMAHLWRNLFAREQIERELDDEVRAFYGILVDRYLSQGLSREEAMRAARIECEGEEQVKEKVREKRIGVSIESALKDLQYAARTLRQNPGFSAVAILTLGLGIGANAAIFSLINAVMLRILPVQHPEQLVLLTDPAESGVDVDTTQHGVRSILSYPEFQELSANNRVFSDLLAAQSDNSDLDVFSGDSSQPVKAQGQLVSGNFFRTLGIKPVVGRVFTSEEDKIPGANPVTVISYSYWQRVFAGNPNVVGSSVRVGHGVFQIIGIAPPGFSGILVGSETDLWFPITMQQEVLPGRNYLTPRDTLWLQVMGRFAAGISLQKAQAGINAAFEQSLRIWAADLPTARQRREMVNEKIELRSGARGASWIRGEFSDPLLLLMAMVGVVLLVACANIANLMLARASGRQREIGVRLALGAGRGRLIRQLLAESFLLAAFGGLLGIVLSSVAARLLLALVSSGVENLGLDVPRDHHVLIFTAALSLATGLLFGLAPAVRGTRLDIHRTLAANTRGSGGDRGTVRTGRILGIAQVAFSLVLLMSAALFVTSLHNMLIRNLGYDASHLLLITVNPQAAGYKGASAASIYETVRERLAGVPGVRSVTLSNHGLFGGDSGDHLSIEGSLEKNPDKLVSLWTEVGANYFSTLRIPLLRGREIDASDAARHAPVCVINESFLRRFFPNQDALGMHITDEYPTTRETFEIVGVVADSIEHSPDEQKYARFYANISHPIGTVEAVTFLLSTSAEPTAATFAARRVLAQFDRNLPILSVETVNQQLDRRLISERLVADLAAFFGALALLVAAIGLYGVMSYSTARRTSEIGIRMALGASGRSVIGMVLTETLGIAIIGAAFGLPCGFAVSKLVSSKLYGVTAGDPWPAAIAFLVLLGSAVIAGLGPARRASRVDPTVSLRYD